MKRGGRLRSRSPRKADRYAAIAAACREALERDRHVCQAVGLLDHVCSGPMDPHHLFPRHVRPDLVADPESIVACCRTAHEWIDGHPDDAGKLGLHGRSWETPEELRVRRATLYAGR